jgi:hypothetical protein
VGPNERCLGLCPPKWINVVLREYVSYCESAIVKKEKINSAFPWALLPFHLPPWDGIAKKVLDKCQPLDLGPPILQNHEKYLCCL